MFKTKGSTGAVSDAECAEEGRGRPLLLTVVDAERSAVVVSAETL